MSWSVNIIGTVDGIKKKLAAESLRLTEQSKQEFDEALPALNILLDLNITNPEYPQAFQLDANGHATFKDGVKTYGQCSVKLVSIGYMAN